MTPFGSSRGGGLVVALCGPDGSGKSTLALALEDKIEAPVQHVHHRPGVLPYPAPDGERDFTQPYVGETHSPIWSTLKVLYLYLDWLLAWLFRIAPHRRRGGWVVIQRPWWDMIVDRARYRLELPSWVLHLLGYMLPRPDLTILLDGSPTVIRRRKPELSPAEIEDQAGAWRDLLARIGGLVVNVDGTVESSLGQIIAAADLKLIRGQLALVSFQRGRWLIPRTPVKAAAIASQLYQPMSLRGRFLRATARLVAQSGVLRLMPSAQIPEEVLGPIRQWLPPGGTLAAKRLTRDRWFIQTITRAAKPGVALKVGVSPSARELLVKEGGTIAAVGSIVAPPLAVPTVRRSGNGLLVMERIDWKPRRNPRVLPPEIAQSLGTMFRAGARLDGARTRGRIHGDFAPWNLLWDGRKWFLIDWEESEPDGPPFYDIFHFFVQSHIILGSPSEEVILAGVRGHGPVGDALAAFSQGADIDLDPMGHSFLEYLDLSEDFLDPAGEGFEAAVSKRRDLGTRWRRES